MFYWALIFFLVALFAGIFGFGGLAGTAAGIAEVLFFIGVIAFVITLIMALAGKRHLTHR